MPPKPLVELESLDLETVEYGPERIRELNPHRYELELLHVVYFRDADLCLVAGYHDAKEDAFWIRGHIPGRPLFPGVLMVEAAAQLCSFYWRFQFPDEPRFFGFGGIDDTKFRGTVVPGDRLVLVGKMTSIRPRRAIFDCQGFVDGQMTFESTITGIVV